MPLPSRHHEASYCSFLSILPCIIFIGTVLASVETSAQAIREMYDAGAAKSNSEFFSAIETRVKPLRVAGNCWEFSWMKTGHRTIVCSTSESKSFFAYDLNLNPREGGFVNSTGDSMDRTTYKVNLSPVGIEGIRASFSVRRKAYVSGQVVDWDENYDEINECYYATRKCYIMQTFSNGGRSISSGTLRAISKKEVISKLEERSRPTSSWRMIWD